MNSCKNVVFRNLKEGRNEGRKEGKKERRKGDRKTECT